MTRAKRAKDTQVSENELVVVYHPRADDASPEGVRCLAGIVSLAAPAPSKTFLGDSWDDDVDSDDGRKQGGQV